VALVDGITSTPERKGGAMGFFQIIEYQTSRIDEIEQVGRAFREELAQSAGVAKPLRGTITADQDRPGYYMSIIEFESAEAAAEATGRAETQAFFARLAGLMDGPPRFYRLAVVETWEMPQHS
jgi:quinol monooxygenase YgiN